MNKDRILEILESAKDKNNDVPMNLVRKAFEKLPSVQPESCGDVISREYLKEHIEACWINGRPRYAPELNELLSWIDDVPSAQPKIIRCKDCEHKPHTSDKYDYDNGDCGFEIIFPDYRCPCRCDDEYYNRIPDDDWYCANAGRRTDE